jgi:hypothetical protein
MNNPSLNDYDHNKQVVSFIREFGCMLLFKENEEWIYYCDIYLNFPFLSTINAVQDHKSYFKLSLPPYMTVQDSTLQNIKNKLGDFEQNYSKYKLNDYFRDQNSSVEHLIYEKNNVIFRKSPINIINDIRDLYQTDTMVKERLIKLKTAILFLSTLYKFVNTSTIIVKGKEDFSAIENTYKMLLKETKKENTKKIDKVFKNIYDIDIFLSDFRMIDNCKGKGNLEFMYTTLADIEKQLLPNSELMFLDLIIKNTNDAYKKFHNPVYDSLITLLCAILILCVEYHYKINKSAYNKSIADKYKITNTINLLKNKTGGSYDNKDLDYLYKCIKYRSKYLKMKREKNSK